MKIFVSGSISGSYRAQNILKAIGDSGMSYCYNPESYFTPKVNNKILGKIVAFFFVTLTFPIRLIQIILSSRVIVLPMNASDISIIDVLIGKLFWKNIIVDYYIGQYDAIVNDRKLAKQNSLRARHALLKDQFFLRTANSVIFLNNSEADYYQKIARVTLDKKKIRIIPLCIDYKKELISVERKDNEFFNVCWWGTYIPLHGLENIIESFALLKNNNIKLNLFGDSDQKASPYIDLIQRLDLGDRVVVNNSYSFSNGKLAPYLGKNCDLALGSFGTSEKAKTVIVNKLVDALSLGLPCLTMKTLAINELFESDEGLIFAEPTPEDIACQLEKYAYERGALKLIGESGKSKYLELFSPDTFKVKLLKLLKE